MGRNLSLIFLLILLFRLESEKEELALDLNRVKSEFEEMADIAKRRQDEIDIIR